jgi:hypothetical protein
LNKKSLLWCSRWCFIKMLVSNLKAEHEKYPHRKSTVNKLLF